ncbi:DUF2169 domain-containing protein [Fibrobacterota bacterium]
MNWLTKPIPGTAPDGAAILSVLGKKTYTIKNGGKAVPDEEEQLPFHESDEYYGEGNPQTDAVKYESDLVAFKPMTDIVVIGNACAPKGKKAYHLDVSCQVGDAKKTLRVFGNRRVYVTGTGIAFSDPEPFEELPTHYGLAYGGMDEQSEDDMQYAYLKNPVGKGFIVRKNPAALQDLPLPNLEDPAKLLTPGNLVLQKFENWKQYPEPAGLGYTGRNFYPRYTLSGLPPDAYQENEIIRQQHMQQMPEIGTTPSSQPPPSTPLMNYQFFNGASPGLQLPYLNGAEDISLVYMDPDHPQFSFQLPGDRPSAWLDAGEGPEEMQMVLHTVEVLKGSNQLAMVWRGSAYYGGPEAMEEFEAFEFGVEA